MSPFSCRACRGGLFRISFFSRVFTRFLSVFSRLDAERGTAEGGKGEMSKREDKGGQWRGEGGEGEKQEGKAALGSLTTGAELKKRGWMEEMKEGKVQAA